jgi:FkbM family methyltransferase
MKAQLRLPPALRALLAKPAFSDLRYLYRLSQGRPVPEPIFEAIATRLRRMDVVVEVGAARGGGTLRLSDVAERVYAFEPNMHSYRILRHFAKRRGNLTVFNLAVGSIEGVVRLKTVSGQPAAYGSSILGLDGISYAGHMKARMVRLDDVVFPVTPSILVVDCEGYEGEVLLGAHELLCKVRGVFVETHSLADGRTTIPDVVSRLEKVNMSVDTLTPKNEPTWVVAWRESAAA